MKKRGSSRLLAVVIFMVTLVSVYTTWAEDRRELSSSSEKRRADVITIDALTEFGRLERPEVIFLHDLHTATLDKKKKDCNTCHLSENDRLSPKFKRLKDAGRDEVMDLYHGECMACHREMNAGREKTGPIEICGDCHRKKPRFFQTREPMGLDKSLHFRHSEALENRCEQCHHEYDEKTKKLVYAKEKEGSCRYCHMAETEDNRISMELASHFSCIDCHRKTLAKNEGKTTNKNKKKVAGPVRCSGCHDPEDRQMIKTVKEVPRINRNQPDVVLIQAHVRGADKQRSATQLDAVPFDHRAHESYNNTCLVCHHESLEACNSCHTLTGSEKGKEIRLEEAMHRLGNEQSCLGCHEIQQRQRECAGCHAFMDKGLKQEMASCRTCHMEPLQNSTGGTQNPEMAARDLLQSRPAMRDTFGDTDIPETVTINELSHQFGPVELPHRRIINTLLKNIKDDKLAQYFHREEGTLCQGCHHNSPAAKRPPSCVSCHGQPFNRTNLLRPGLKAAYHQQCMGCHVVMGIKKPQPTGCIECHEEKGTSRLKGI